MKNISKIEKYRVAFVVLVIVYIASICVIVNHLCSEPHLENVLVEPADDSGINFDLFVMSSEDAKNIDAVPQKTKLLTTVEITHEKSLANSAKIIYVPEGSSAAETYYYVTLGAQKIIRILNN